MALPAPWWAQEKRVLALGDEAGSGQLVDKRAVHLLVEGEIEAVERSVWVAEGGLLQAAPKESRHECAVRDRVRQARFPELKTLDAFDFGCDDKLTTALLDRLAEPATIITTRGKSFRTEKRLAQPLEFPGFRGDPVTGVSGLIRTAPGSRRRDDCGGGFDCRSYRCSRRRPSSLDRGSCRSAS